MKRRHQGFEVCVRAVIISRGRVLVCYHRLNQHYFFPGGHVEYGELAEKALERELKEELDIRVKKASFIGLTENIYQEKGEAHHEINLVFQVWANRVKDKSREDHLDFTFLPLVEFRTKRVLPSSLQKSVVKWLKDKKIFRVCEVRR
ncbi:MAG: NUDIX domain-containing protein [Candidatus Nealsonbacteria bacterium]|nr:NUDIX domain-containing protein [Candidatus Nealsonbacteria bacterium]